jgi:hypothetical protein
MVVVVTPDLAPVYRYYTVDLLTNEVLAEIPFAGVTYERAVKAAGRFSGKIPAIEKTAHLNLYETTLPGKTALFVVRNGICVWGGLIWTRSYNVVDRVLNVSASEFTSYLYHRRIWKTWGHQYEGIVTVLNGQASVNLVNGSTTALRSGSSVNLEFYEVENFKYNDFYTVADAPVPTRNTFSLAAATQTAKVVSVKRSGGVATVTTDGQHHYSVGDVVTLADTTGAFDGVRTVSSVAGAMGNQFAYVDTGGTVPPTAVDGTSDRTIADGVYGSVTVTVRTDTFEYIRDLLDGVFGDFMGIDFPNVYIEPGIRYPVDVSDVRVQFGRAEITTRQPHNLAIGQAVELQDVHPLVNGEHIVTETPTETSFWFDQGGLLDPTSLAPVEVDLLAVAAVGGVATLVVSSTVGLQVGQTIEVDAAALLPGSSDIFTGSFKIASIPSTFTLTYNIGSTETFPQTDVSGAKATVGANTQKVVSTRLDTNVAWISTLDDHGFAVGNSVTLAGIMPRYELAEKLLDAANSSAKITTAVPHNLQTGDVVNISGLRDSSTVTKYAQSGTSVTLTTDKAHNFKVGDVAVIENVMDVYRVSNKALTSNVATLTTAAAHNLSGKVGQSIEVSDIYDVYTPTQKQLSLNVATLTLSANHNYKVNDTVEVSNIIDVSTVRSKAVDGNIVTLATSTPHNFLEGEKITITNVGDLYNGEIIVLESATTQFTYRLSDEKVQSLVDQYVSQGKMDKANDIKANGVFAPPTTSNGTATSTTSIFNGEHVVDSVTSNSFSFKIAGSDVPTTAIPGGTTPTVSGWSIFNGTYTIASASGSSFTYARTGQNVSSTPVPLPPAPESTAMPANPIPSASISSVANGTRTITSMSRNTVTFTATGTTQVVRDATGAVSVNSIFNGTRTITGVSTYRANFALTAPNNVFETSVTNKSYMTLPQLYNGTYTITGVPNPKTFLFTKAHTDMPAAVIRLQGTVSMTPMAIISTFGPYPQNTNLGIEYSTRLNSGVNVLPTMYRGFELTNVGEALDKYSDSLDGFEYRIDCHFDENTNQFRKVFVLIPINFPDPPAPGEVSPLSRYGADRLVFEYPGNIINVSIEESAENSATRFFAVGENDLGPDAGPPFSVAVADDLLNRRGQDEGFREWPILDDDEKIDDIDDEAVLYSYAERYLNETRPPEAKLTVQVNGSLQPLIGTYAPGDWCSLIVNDEFVKMRLASDLEPRDTVLVRKIDSMRVTVPDGTTFPERVDLTLVPEWEVDSIGK